MEAIIALALLSAFNAQIYATSRLVFDMAKDHCAPGFFLKQNRAGSPINAVILSMVFAFASVGLQFWNPPGLLAFLFNAVGGCLLVIWSFIVASFIKLHPALRDNGELTEIHVPGFPWLPWVTAAALAGLTLLMLFDPAARNQVIVVTHLPQVAAYADTHLHVAKDVSDEAVTSGVLSLSAAERIDELARMMAGLDDSDTGKAHAKELFARAQREVEELRQ